MSIHLVAAALLGLVTAGQDVTPSRAPAPAATQGSQAAAPAATPPQERLVCRRERGIGSNRSERVCTTVAERAEARASTRQFLERSGDASEPTSFPSGHSLE